MSQGRFRGLLRRRVEFIFIFIDKVKKTAAKSGFLEHPSPAVSLEKKVSQGPFRTLLRRRVNEIGSGQFLSRDA